jgi:dihydrofolate reductase
MFEWQFALEAWARLTGQEGGEVNASTPVFDEALSDYGAVVMGRNMFGGGRGSWPTDPPWRGWWGEDPPYHTPVFVLTHHGRDPEPMQGGTTFHFITEGIESALARAKQAAGDQNVLIAGGAIEAPGVTHLKYRVADLSFPSSPFQSELT